ncbi:MFS transporter [Actinacidiphila acididurans]|uniref:MFS transporter n=1 Tax=Actinacidiphila acididurans TaxID=2784346 RepID=A0ABS2TY03_9ACTN|nr:MFS transporter [Actinacidiphila acididurans]MBM9506828.1 MFS transporter [Actinacidiphila acididurans]
MSGALDEQVSKEPPEVSSGTLWRNTDFLKFWSGEALSLFGTQITSLALPLTAVIAFDASAEAVGLLRFLQLVPYLFLALVFGVWVDRGRRKPIMMAANAVRMLLIALIPLLWHLHHLSMSGLLVIACVVGVFSVLFDVSWMSFVPTLVKDSRHYVEANQKLGVTQSTTDVAGPGVAGVLIGWLGPPTAMVLDAVSYLASLAGLLLIRTPEPVPPRSDQAKRHLGRELLEGVRWVFGHGVLRSLAVLAPFTNFSLTCVQTLFLLYGVRDRGLSPEAVGLVFSCSSVGALLGALMSRSVLRRYPVGPVYGLALAAIYTAPLLLPLAGGPRPVVIALFILSLLISYFGSGLSNVTQLSLRQTITPGSLMGRMNAAFRTLLFGGGALGGLFGGLIGGAIGLRPGLTVVAICSAAMVVPIALSPVVRLRAMPAPETEPATSPEAA